ncbi:MAG: PDZ domain-containing protein [Ruminococcaceae bacterium]|nr:PDZ domain-containing protein [Oscillospiraceae bacterium]
MKKKITVGTTVVLILLAALLTFQVTYHFVGLQYQAKVETLTKTQSDFSLLAEADPVIRENFLGEVDDEKAEIGLIQGYVSSLGDPYSAYLTAEEYTRYKKEKETTGSAIGVRLTFDSAQNRIVVYSVLQGSPAQKEGMLPGDVLTSVAGKKVEDLGFFEVMQLLHGEPGTKVDISVRREIAMQVLDMNFTVTRDKVKANAVAYSVLEGNVGYMQIFSFEEGAVSEFHTAVNALVSAQVRGIVFDVRNTSGGDATASIKMLDRLLPEGIMVRTVNHKGEKKELKSDATCLQLPMAVLMNSETSFSAEIFAATLKDFGAATLVGEKTYGKSMEQKALELDNGSALLLSVLAYQPPVSPSFESAGIEPDVAVALEGENIYLLDQKSDNQLQRACALIIGENH